MAIWRLPFHKLLHQSVGEGATLFHGLLHYTFDPNLIMVSVKQGGIKYHFFEFWGLTRPGIKPQSPGPLTNTLSTEPMGLCQYIYIWKWEKLEQCKSESTTSFVFWRDWIKSIFMHKFLKVWCHHLGTPLFSSWLLSISGALLSTGISVILFFVKFYDKKNTLKIKHWRIKVIRQKLENGCKE